MASLRNLFRSLAFTSSAEDRHSEDQAQKAAVAGDGRASLRPKIKVAERDGFERTASDVFPTPAFDVTPALVEAVAALVLADRQRFNQHLITVQDLTAAPGSHGSDVEAKALPQKGEVKRLLEELSQRYPKPPQKRFWCVSQALGQLPGGQVAAETADEVQQQLDRAVAARLVRLRGAG